MARIDVRGIDDVVVLKIDGMAKKKGMSREAFVRVVLTQLTMEEGIREVEEKYANLVLVMAEVVENNTYELVKLGKKIKEISADSNNRKESDT